VSRRPASTARCTASLPTLVIAVFAALALAACDTPAASVAPTPTRAPEPTPLQTVYTLGIDVWYEGLVLHMDRATALLDARGGTVDIAFRIDNPGAEPSDLDARMLLVVAGNRIEPTSESHVPSTPAGETSLALLTFELQEIASADDAVLEIGAESDHIARVPFGPEGGEAVTFEPIELEVKGTNAAGDLRINLRGGVVRWDLPDWSQELSKDLRALTLTYDVTYNGSFAGGFAFTGDNVALLLPDKTMVEARRDGHSQSVELIGAGKTKRRLFSRFEIPADARGEFRLVVRNGSTEKGIVFTIED
jgi:hypothetical protein